MRLILRLLLSAVTVVVLSYPAVSGASLNPFNDRPVTVTVTTDAGNSLQSILDQIYGPGVVSAVDDQNTAGMWRASALRFPTIAPVLQFTYGTSAAIDSFGIWSIGADDTVSAVTIFAAGSTAGDAALLRWNSAGQLTVNGIATGDDINPYAFGFFTGTTNPTTGAAERFYTVDALNPGNSAQALSYLYNPGNGAGAWVIAFNDVLTGGSAASFNNLVVSVESITALPEPQSIALLGTSVIVLAGGLIRRRMSRRRS